MLSHPPIVTRDPLAGWRLFVPALLLTLGITTLSPLIAHAQIIVPSATTETSTLHLVKDINGSGFQQTTASSAIEGFAATDDFLFFFVAVATVDEFQELTLEQNADWHLWRTDGTEEGTQRAIDLTGYERSNLPTQAGTQWLYLFTQRDNSLYLFRTDGTSTTELGAIPSNQSVLAQSLGMGDIFYYVTGRLSSPAEGITLWRVTPDAVTPIQLWHSDALEGPKVDLFLQATDSAIYIVVHPLEELPILYVAAHGESTLLPLTALDAWPNAVSWSNHYFYFFVADDSLNQLWRTSGTLPETVSLFTAPLGNSVETILGVFTDENDEDHFYFTYYFLEVPSPYHFAYSELWYSNGTPGNARLVKNFDSYAQMDNFQFHENKAFFWLYNKDGGYTASQDARMIVTDGTTQGTDYVNTNLSYSPSYTIIGHNHYFAKQEPMVYDATTGQSAALQIADINFGPPASLSRQPEFGSFQNVVYFPATNGIDGMELWRSDGTTGGTWQVKNINTRRIPTPYYLLPPTRETTPFLTDLSAGDNVVYFVADEGRNGPHVYRSDGTEAGTNLLPNATLNNQWTNPRQLTTQGDTVYFLAEDHLDTSENIHGLWRSDGTEEGTRLLVDNLWAYQASLTLANNRLLLLDMPHMSGSWGLWRLNENQDKFEMLIDFSLWGGGGQEFSQVDFVSLSNQTFFQNPTNTPGAGLWRSDATVGGTFRMDGYNGQRLLAGKTLVYGKIFNSDSSIRYWRSDGTSEGTFEIKTFYPSPAEVISVSAREIVVGDRLYIAYTEWGKQIALWSSDGTVNGTQLLGNLFSSGDDSPPSLGLAADGNLLYIKEFTAFEDASLPSITIWRSDGTPAGTRPMMNFFYVFQDMPTGLMANQGNVFFNVRAPSGTYLVRTNGEPLCTWVIDHFYSDDGPPVNTNYEYVKAGDNLYFMNNDLSHGYELWVADTSIPQQCSQLYLPGVSR